MAKRSDEETLVTSQPRIGLLLYPFKNHFKGITNDNCMEVKRINATSSVKTMNYQTSKSSPSGTFSITLTSDRNWTQIVRPGDWLLLYESAFDIGIHDGGNDTTKGLRCLGNIDRVSRQKSINNEGQRVFTYRIDGRDFGKVFEKIKFYYDPYIPKKVQENFAMLKSGIKITGTPASFVKSYLSLYLGNGWIIDEGLPKDQRLKKLEELDQLRIPKEIMKVFGVNSNDGKLYDLLRTDIPEDELAPVGYSWSIPPDRATNGSLWDILTSVSNNTMNEMYLSMKFYPAEDKIFPTLTLRKQPWSKNIFGKLPYLVVQESMILTDDVGFNDHERANWINLDPKNSFIANYPQFIAASQATTTDKNTKAQIPLFPNIDKLSIRRYGMQQRQLSSEFIQITEGDRKSGSVKTDLQLAEKWMEDLIEWWENYERYESGTILVKGFSEVNVFTKGKDGVVRMNDVKINNNDILKGKERIGIPSDQYNVGSNIYCNSRERLFQLEGFSLEWQAPGISHVTLAVTRGVFWTEAKKQIKFVDEVDSTDQEELSVTVIKR